MRSLIIAVAICISSLSTASAQVLEDSIYNPGELKPVDSRIRVAIGQEAPDFTLPAVNGGTVTLSSYRTTSNVVISFVPAAWTPVCSNQWPGYNIAEEVFTENNTVMIGITVDNIPTLFAWTKAMGKLWFPVGSDFYPHGAVAEKYGVLRTNGEAERALFLIDKSGIIRYIDVHDINKRPPLDVLVEEMKKLQK